MEHTRSATRSAMTPVITTNLEDSWQLMEKDSGAATNTTPTPSDILSDEEAEEPTTLLVFPKIYCDVSNKKYNLFDRFSYIQFTGFVVNAKLSKQKHFPPRLQFPRNTIYAFLNDNLDKNNPDTAAFLHHNELTLRKLKNKRQLLLFLHKKFTKIHDLNNRQPYNRVVTFFRPQFTSFSLISAFLPILLLSLLSILGLGYLFFKTTLFEQLFEHHPSYIRFIKTTKLIIVAMINDL